MFGDKPIKGYQTGSVDAKNRIIIPKYTGIEPGEEVSVIVENNELSIISTSQLDRLYEKVRKLENTTDLELLREIRACYEQIIISSNADKQGRITLGQGIQFEDKKIEFVGAGDRIKIKGSYTYPSVYKKGSK